MAVVGGAIVTAPLRIVLASASPARRRLLERAGLAPEVRVSTVDEDALIDTASRQRMIPVAEQAQMLARAKAEQVAAAVIADTPLDSVLIIGCDTILELDGQPHNKPMDAAQARARWAQMAGRVGTLHTGHTVILHRPDRPDVTRDHVATAQVQFGRPTDAEVDAYIASGEPLRVAGAFTLEGLGGAFIEHIEGTPSAIEGLSLPALRAMLADAGIIWTDLWQVSERNAS